MASGRALQQPAKTEPRARKQLFKEVRASVEEQVCKPVIGYVPTRYIDKTETGARSEDDVLASPSNLFREMLNSPACLLCLRGGTVEHVLSCCPKALGEIHYGWQHDKVL